MSHHHALTLTAEITVTDGHIDGTVRAAGQPGRMFSGWSELFGVLTRLIGEAEAPPAEPDAAAQPSS